jgi:NAD-dependent SIR2 family protein deacetylase
MPALDDDIARAATLIRDADALLIGAGAGMGVDSGLPDFRGNQGFWRAYPRYGELGLRFEELANPAWFREDPAMAWGFYGHRRNLYRRTRPHEGFEILRRWSERSRGGGFVFTSNVDGQFQRAGFDEHRVAECHGAIDWSQCTGGEGECAAPFPADDAKIEIDEETMRAEEPLPRCPRCGAMARPNILMFGDWRWEPSRTAAQERRLEAWLASHASETLVAVELGAGTAIPTVRSFCEATARGRLIRINPREPQTRRGGVELPLGALAALTQIDHALGDMA